MNKEACMPPLGRRLVLALGLLILPLSVVSQTEAKGTERVLVKPTPLVVSAGAGITIRNAANLRAQVLHLIERKGLKLKAVKVLHKGCGCSAVAPEDLDGGWKCLTGCLANYGVSAVQVIMCGASCALAETGAGAIICAICVGVDVTLVTFCALRCAMYAARLRDPAIRFRDNLKPIRTAHGSRKIWLTSNSVGVGS